MKAQNRSKKYEIKKCPACLTSLSTDAERCTSCNQKVGAINAAGIAEMPIDWMAYFKAFLAILAFSFFIWWVFLK